MSKTKRPAVQAEIAAVYNLDRKFGEVSEQEGYIRVRPEKGKVALFTRREWQDAIQRAERNPEDVHDDTEFELDVIEAIAYMAGRGVEFLEARQQDLRQGLDRAGLNRYHAPQVVDRILDDRDGRVPRGELSGRTVTICACDVQGLSGSAELIAADEMSSLLDSYFERMTQIVFGHRGTLVNQVDEGLIAIFGAPYSHGNDAEAAVEAALEMRAAFDQLVSTRPSIGPRRLRVGMTTGWALCGAIGRPGQLRYTALGETVDMARQLRGAAPQGAILVGSETEPLVNGSFECEEAGMQPLKAGKAPIKIYQILGRV